MRRVRVRTVVRRVDHLDTAFGGLLQLGHRDPPLLRRFSCSATHTSRGQQPGIGRGQVGLDRSFGAVEVVRGDVYEAQLHRDVTDVRRS